MPEHKKEKILKAGVMFLAALLLLSSCFIWRLWKETKIQTIPVTAYMDSQNLDLNATVTLTDLASPDGTEAKIKKGHLYEVTIRYAINGVYGNWAVYGCSEMETVTTFVARKEKPQIRLTAAFDSSRITDGSGVPFDPDTMSLVPYVTVEEQQE